VSDQQGRGRGRARRTEKPKPVTGEERVAARAAFEKIRERSDRAGVIVNPAALAAYNHDVQLVRRVLAERVPRAAESAPERGTGEG
jgi:hypothetical protein